MSLSGWATSCAVSTPHWWFAMGFVLMELERFSEGLEHLEAVIELRSDYALAYNCAARCAFRMGGRGQGDDDMPKRLTGWVSRRNTGLAAW